MIAPKISFKGKYTISPSLQFNGIKNSFWENSDKRLALKMGIMFNSSKHIIGLSYNYDPGLKLIQERLFKEKLPDIANFNLIMSYTFSGANEDDLSFTPTFLLGMNSDFPINWYNSSKYPYNLFLNLKAKRIIGGIDLYGNIMLGYESDKFKVMLSQRYSKGSIIWELPDDRYSRSYTAQLSLRYIFKNNL